MNKALLSEVLRLGGDPTDETWRWLVLTGPHGPSFSWSQRTSEPAGYVGLQQLHEIIQEKADQDPAFRTRARAVARQALMTDDTVVLRRGIQVTGALGLVTALPRVEELGGHPNPSIAADARACLFELRQHRHA
jgi:hypothetical protein